MIVKLSNKISSPRFDISFITALTPPAASISSIWTVDKEGEILAIWETRLEIVLISFNLKSTSASLAIANMWSTVLEDPPIAISTAKAFLTAFSFKIFRNTNFFLSFSFNAISQILLAAFLYNTSLAGVKAKIVPFPGNAIPIASINVFIELAVNIPEQEPPLGHALHSMSSNSSSVISPASCFPTASKAVAKSIGVPSFVWPFDIGPPDTKIVGTFTLNAPIIIPGTILSQFGIQIIASNLCACITVSIELAIISLEGRENNIPSCPIAIPSSTPIVLNSKGTQPFFLISSLIIIDTLSKK